MLMDLVDSGDPDELLDVGCLCELLYSCRWPASKQASQTAWQEAALKRETEERVLLWCMLSLALNQSKFTVRMNGFRQHTPLRRRTLVVRTPFCLFNFFKLQTPKFQTIYVNSSFPKRFLKELSNTLLVLSSWKFIMLKRLSLLHNPLTLSPALNRQSFWICAAESILENSPVAACSNSGPRNQTP